MRTSNTQGSKWLRQLQLFAVLMLISTSNAFATQNPWWRSVDTKWRIPRVTSEGNLTPNIDDKSHVYFSFIWYNFDGDNAWYDNSEDVKLYIDGREVLNLTREMYNEHPNWSCRMFGGSRSEKEADRVCNHDEQVLHRRFNSSTVGSGTITLTNPYRGDEKSYQVNCDVTLDNLRDGKTHTIKIWGKWAHKNGKREWMGPEVKITAPKVSFPSNAGTIVSTGNHKATHSISGLDPQYGKTTRWRYALVDYKKSPGDDTSYSSNLTYGNGSLDEGVSSGQTEISIPSNYEPTTVYTRVRRYNTYTWRPGGGNNTDRSSNISYTKDFQAIVVPGFIRAKDLKIEPEQWSRNVALYWDKEGKENAISKGKWVIFRRNPDKTYVNLGSTPSGTMKFVHKDINEPNEYDVKYSYYVCFLPESWGITDATTLKSPDEMADLYVSDTITITRHFSMDFVREGDDACIGLDKTISLKWTYNPSFADASASNPYTVKLMRAVNGVPDSDPLKTFTITNKKDVSHSYTDSNIGNSYDTETYYLEVDAMDKVWKSPTISLSTTGKSQVTSVEATRGNHTGMVKLYWNAEQKGNDPTYYEVYRRPLGSNDEDDWVKVFATSGNATKYSYDDTSAQAGEYYEYKVSSYIDHLFPDGRTTTDPISATCDGFSLATGVVSGRVSFGTGTAVDSVRVTLSNEGGEVVQQSHSMYFHNMGSAIEYYGADDLAKLFGKKSFAVQMYVNPSSDMLVGTNRYPLFTIPSTLTLSLGGYDPDAQTIRLYLTAGGVTDNTQLTLPTDAYSHLTLSYNNDSKQVTLTVIDNANKVSEKTLSKSISLSANATQFVLGGASDTAGEVYYKGYVDEFRVFSGQTLSLKNIMANYNHPLAGTEAGLSIYWPFDEGLAGQQKAYDYSKKNGVLNGRHGSIKSNTTNSFNVPGRDQLGLLAITDSLGNYVIRGVPFTAEGTNYIVTPSKGVHEFSPSSSTRVVSANSLVHSAVDFTDVSSFVVSGYMYYEGTTYPVEGATISVDGSVSMRDGNIVYTDDHGYFEIDVPIGKHYLTAAKDGHTFVNGGRFPNPDDYDGKAIYPFVADMKDQITFYDNTLVPIVGRISGGPKEDEKPLGFGLSENLIGQARITLNAGKTNLNAVKLVDGSSITYTESSTPREYGLPDGTHNLASHTIVGAGETGAYTMTIETDPLTGEFAAMVPPLQYTVEHIEVINNPSISWNTMSVLDASNVLVTTTDSTNIDGVDYTFEYVASLKKNYRSAPVMKVTQLDAEAEGAFGEYEYTYKDRYGQNQTIQLYDTNGDFSEVPVMGKYGGIDAMFGGEDSPYTFDYPIFLEGAWYDFFIKVFEPYTNADNNETVNVPLEGVTVDVEGSLGSGTQVLLEDTGDYKAGEVENNDGGCIELDENGEAIYHWMAGLPNISEEGEYLRTLSMSYYAGTENRQWEGNGFAGKILGSLPGGTNFVTGGPDRVLMVLRDPPGSASSAYIEEGTTVTTSTTSESTTSINNNDEMVISVGTTRQMITGAVTGGPVGSLIATSIELETESTVTTGLELTKSTTTGGYTNTDVTFTKRISTSAEPEYVGAVGDVFIGTATNYSYGTGVQVYINEDGQLARREVMERSDVFGTEFQYSQYYVENVLIPRYAEMRDSTIKVVSEKDYNNEKYPNPNEFPIYISTLAKTEKNFGSDNSDEAIWKEKAVAANSLTGPSYRMVLPDSYVKNYKTDTRVFSDTIKWYNQQILHWQQVLANNEDAKVKAIQNRADYLMTNVSFDTGASIEMSSSTSTTKGYTNEENFSSAITVGGGTNVDLFGSGTALNFTLVTTVETKETYDSSTTTTREIGFNLTETGDDDVLTVDIFNAPDGFGPIFYTAGGQTSCPYEDEVVAKYSKKNKGAVLSNKTQQIERPRIECVSNIVTGVPANKGATFNVLLYNDSETKEDCYFNLNIPDIENQHGANVLMDGVSLNYGRTILVPAGARMNKVVQIFQTDDNVTDFERIPVRISSTCQPDNTSTFPEIADTTYLTAHFQPAVSDVTLECAQTAITLSTGTTPTFTIKNYDYNYNNLNNIKLQCKQYGAPQWTDCKEWVKGKDDEEMKVGNMQHTVDMSNNLTYPDGTWIFRAITTSDIGEPYIYSSEEITLIKDTNRPQLIAMAQPSDGILDAGDEISLTFNEDIRSGQLTQVDNFYIRGELNAAQIDHEVALNLTNGAPAKTESRIDLANRSWAVNMWVNYTSAGHLLTHGVSGNQFDLSVNNSDKLVATVGGKSYTALNTMPKDTWTFLSLSYDAESSSISANCAYDGYEKVLFTNQTVGEYTGNGCLALGEGLTGQIHEVTLWDNARPWVEALSEKSTSKSRYTNGLIGYWRFNEGHGATSTDKSRSRTMTLPSATAWYINAKNYALELDGQKATAIPLSKSSTRDYDSYLLELWFRADASNSATASIVSMGDNKLDLRLNEAGGLELVASGANYTVSQTDYRDNQWHHLALNALKSTSGNATVYVDGVALKSVSASAVPALAADYLFLGSHRKTEGSTAYNQMLKGAVDEVRIWKQRCTADVVRSNIYNRVDKTISELIAYYPFEYSTVDANNVPVVKLAAEDVSPVDGGAAVILNNGMAKHSILDTNVVGLKPAPTKVNVPFNFVASERKILVNLTQSPEIMEGCTVNLTVKGVKDLQDNRAESISWDVYVRQNQLRWSSDETSVRKESAEEASFTVDIVNTGGTNENWAIDNLPTWLKASAESGTLLPQSSKTITFTVDPATAAGRYEETILLSGSLGIAEPFVVSLVSAVEAPDWAVNGDDFEYNMNLVGRIQVDGAYSENAEDIVAAFHGTECVGVAHPVYFPRYDGYYVMMTVYGNEEDEDEALTFKLFDATTGTIYPSVAVSQNDAPLAMVFKADVLHGALDNPLIFAPEKTIEQTLALRKGWTWTSLYVTPVSPALSAVFKDYPSVKTFKSKLAFSTVSGSGAWIGDLSSATPNQMYKIKADDKTNVSVLGEPIDPKTMTVTVAKGWNWIGYNCSGSANLNTAFADLSPAEGDMVKSQSQFSIYTGGEWVGTLAMLTPGMGYCYQSKASTTRQFHYPAVSNVRNVRLTRAPMKVDANMPAGYESNMTVMAVVKDGDMVIKDAAVSVYADGELRAYSAEPVREGVHFLTVGGDSKTGLLRFVVHLDDNDYLLSVTDTFHADAVSGTLQAPFELQMSDATGLDRLEGEESDVIYDLSGRMIPRPRLKGIYIQGGKKVVVK